MDSTKTAVKQTRGSDKPKKAYRVEPLWSPGEPFNPYKVFFTSWVPDQIMWTRDLDPAQKLILARLMRYAGKDGEAFPTIKELAREVGLGERQTQRHLAALESLKLIRRGGGGGRSNSNSIKFFWHQIYEIREAPKKASRKTPFNQPEKVSPKARKGVIHDEKGCHEWQEKVSSMTPPYKEEENQEENHHHQDNQLRKSIPRCPDNSDDSKKGIEKTSFQFKSDDDEARLRAPKRQPLEDPVDEFMARLNERHYGIDAATILESVATQLPPGIDVFRAFLNFDARMTTKPAAIKNPGGYYRDLVPKFRERNLTASQLEYRNYKRELETKEP